MVPLPVSLRLIANYDTGKNVKMNQLCCWLHKNHCDRPIRIPPAGGRNGTGGLIDLGLALYFFRHYIKCGLDRQLGIRKHQKILI